MAEISETVLSETATRLLRFMGAVQKNKLIYGLLQPRGFTPQIFRQGWALALRAVGYVAPSTDGTTEELDSANAELEATRVRAAAEIDAWDEPNFRIAKAALEEFPAQRDFVFANLTAAVGAASIASVTTFLDRLDLLESGHGRKESKKRDRMAIEKLAERGITQEEWTRMRGLLKAALTVSSEAAMGIEAPITDSELHARQVAAYEYFAEWSEVARAMVKSRAQLIQLGLARRKRVGGGKARGSGVGGKVSTDTVNPSVKTG